MRYSMFAAMYAQGLLSFGHNKEAQAAVEEALEWSKVHDELWFIPELMRIQGEILGASDGLDARGVSEALYTRAIEIAQQQGALLLELRAAGSLARLKHRQRKTKQASSVLAAVYDKFTEGFAIVDLKQARALLESFRGACGSIV